jgi:aromatic-L-amino-acid decarboxylase
MRADALESAIAADRSRGATAVAVVATIGTTATTSVDPIREIANVCRRHSVWLHVDAAYAGVTAMLPERRAHFDGWDLADSIVVNPHKWLFVPFDLSVLYCRRMDLVRRTFSLVPEFLQTPERSRGAKDLMDTGIQLGRRFRALKLWMVLRHFGAEAIRATIAEHMRLARTFAAWVDADPDFERVAPVPFSVVCFRVRPRDWRGSDSDLDAFNAALLDAVNATGEVFLSHTRLGDRFVLRLAIGHLRTSEAHVSRAWALLQSQASALQAGSAKR